MIMPYEYPVNWDALILLYQGTTSRFIESKTLKMAIFQPKMALKSQNSQFFFKNLSNIIMPCEYPVNWDALILLYQGTTSQFF